jgi:hypothetical protein
MECAKEAISEPVRKQFLDLAKLWMTAAAQIDSHSMPLQADKMDGHARPHASTE